MSLGNLLDQSARGGPCARCNYRYLTIQSGAAEQTYTLVRDANDSSRDWHQGLALFDPTGAVKNWSFNSAAGAWWSGFLTAFNQQASSGGPLMRSQDFTWAQDPVGN